MLLDPSISDLMINGTTGVYADRDGVVQAIPLSCPYTNERLQAAIERVARILGQDLTTQNPILNTRLPDGSRVAVVGPPSSINGPTLTIRKFNRWYSSDQLIASGTLPAPVRDRVVGFLAEKKNGMISGGTGSGKTTLLKAFLDHIPLNDAGLPAADILDFDYPAWHTHRDTPEQLSAASLAQAGRVAAWLVYASPLARP